MRQSSARPLSAVVIMSSSPDVTRPLASETRSFLVTINMFTFMFGTGRLNPYAWSMPFCCFTVFCYFPARPYGEQSYPVTYNLSNENVKARQHSCPVYQWVYGYILHVLWCICRIQMGSDYTTLVSPYTGAVLHSVALTKVVSNKRV